MANKDINIVLGPDKAREMQVMLDWYRRYPYKSGPPDGYVSRPSTNSNVPIPKLGKAHDNIAPRTFGAVDIWSGKPGSETQLTFLTSPVQEFNLLDRTITAGKWVWMFGQYIFGAHFPAQTVYATLSGALATSGTATAAVSSYFGGDDPGGSITVHSAWTQTASVASGKKIVATWNDKLQQYDLFDWSC